MVAGQIAWLGAKMRELLAAWDPERPSLLRTFDDVEDFWERTVRPALAEFKSMQPSWYEKAAPDYGVALAGRTGPSAARRKPFGSP